jgi:indolepyruvate ferredoxin oxidoreductase alpha subunit
MAGPKTKWLLLGNEAIVRGALEAGVGFVTTYPGTPASEIGDRFFEIAPKRNFYFEYSVNEKVALEMAGAAAASGVRAFCAMKHVGLNVAADALMSLAYTGVRAGLVVLSADDPSMHSSQNEQDNRFYAKLANIPMLEPTDAQEALEMNKYAFELSEKLELPVLLRTTTRLNHTRSIVSLGTLPEFIKTKNHFIKEPSRYVIIPAIARQRHKILLERMAEAEKLSEMSPYTRLTQTAQAELGILTSGVSYNYVLDAIQKLGILERVNILKIGYTHPLPRKLCEDFLRATEKILVVEELEPYLETELKAIVADLGLRRNIYGKSTGHFSRLYEYTPYHVRQAIATLLGISIEEASTPPMPVTLPTRIPQLCAGCPHRATYELIKSMCDKNTIFPTDIGCYSLGVLPPFQMADFLLCMGSSIGSAGAFRKVTDQPVIAFIGDSTFFHSGIPALINAVHNNHKFLLVIMDNQTTAMTGHQPDPGTALTDFTPVCIEEIVRACGVKHLFTIDPYLREQAKTALQQALNISELTVIVSRHVCPLFIQKRRSYEAECAPVAA